MHTLLPQITWRCRCQVIFFCLASSVASLAAAEPAVLLRREVNGAEDLQQIGLHHAFAQRTAQEERAWDQTVDWLQHNDASVNPNLVGRSITGAEGVQVRGLFFNTGTANAGDALLRVPKRLWLHLDTVPRIRTAAKQVNHYFSGSDDFDEFVLSIVVALQMVKGSDSFFYPYLKGLPDIEEYRSYLPMLASEEILQAFSDLPVVSILRKQQEVHAGHRTAFETWQRLSHHPYEIDSLSWPVVELALMRLRTRRHSVVDNAGKTIYALVPACDWLNTAGANAINTRWVSSGEDELSLVATRDIQAGDQLYAPYCLRCHNAHLVSVWGVYISGNPYSLGSAKDVDCDKRELYRGVASSKPTLKQTTEEALDFTATERDLSLERSGFPRVPRCRQPHVADDAQRWLDTQGPIRCSLARLAWEHCGTSWERPVHVGKELASTRPPSGISTANIERISEASESSLAGNTAIGAVEQMAASAKPASVRATMPAGLADALAAAAGKD